MSLYLFYPSFQVLIGILQRRIELDKEVLFQFNTIKHEAGLVDLQEKNPTIAPTLMKFQRGCHQVSDEAINYFAILGLIICQNPPCLSLMSVCHAATVMKTKQVASCKTPQNMTIPPPANHSPVWAGSGTNPMAWRAQHAKQLDCWQKPDTVFQPTWDHFYDENWVSVTSRNQGLLVTE